MIEYLACDKYVIRCCVGIHPAWNLETQLYGGGCESSIAKNCGTIPVILVPAGNDSEGLKPGGDPVAILSLARGNIKHNGISIEFPDMKHGWVSREYPDLDETVQRQEQEKAMHLCCEFIRTHHKK